MYESNELNSNLYLILCKEQSGKGHHLLMIQKNCQGKSYSLGQVKAGLVEQKGRLHAVNLTHCLKVKLVYTVFIYFLIQGHYFHCF